MSDRKSLGQLKKLWNDTPPRIRWLVIGTGAAAMVTIMLWTFGVFGGDDYEPVFTGLEPQDAAEIVAILEADKIPYRLEGSGTTISVPSASVYQVRLNLASQGLPRGGTVGYELLDRTQFGATEFDKRISYLRALQGELARTIVQIDGVEKARVHIVIPENSLFVSDKKSPTAAVLLSLRPGTELGPEQVRGITNLVSRSVEGLSPQDVTIVDDYGQILSTPEDERTTPAMTNAQLDSQQRFTRELESRLETLLERVFGPGNAICRVSATLNFDERVIERTMFVPPVSGEGLVRTVRELEEHFSGDAGAAAGIPGTSSNTGEVPIYQAAGTTGNSEYERREVAKEVELNQTIEHQIIAPGTVERLSVSAVINRQLEPEEQVMVEQMVASAIGYDETRRDQITVTGLEFDQTLVEELRTSMEAERQAEAMRTRVWLIVIGVTTLVLIMAVIIVRRRIAKARERAELEALREAQAKPAEIPLDDEESVFVQKEIERLVRQRPETAAHLIRAWLTEE